MTAANALPASARPAARRDRVTGVVTALWILARVELVVRRASVDVLCARFGSRFGGLAVPERTTPQVLPHDVLDRWWAVEAVLRRWPWARQRPCLRRSLVLGHRLRDLDPELHVEVVALEPFRAHAFLQVKGNRLDTGDVGTLHELGVTP